MNRHKFTKYEVISIILNAAIVGCWVIDLVFR